MDKMLKYSGSRDERNKRAIMECLAKKRDASYIQRIIDIANGADPVTVRYSIELLDQFNDQKVQEYYLNLFQSPTAKLSVKISAINAFCKYITVNNKQQLTSFLSHENDAIKLVSAKSFAIAGFKDGEDEVLFLSTNSNIIVQREALEAIGYFKNKDHIPLLQKYISDPDPIISKNANLAIKMILGDNFNDYLLQSSQDGQQSENQNNNSFLVEESTRNRASFENNTRNSDIDQNIPITTTIASNKFALIIGNEDYSSFQKNLNSESNVVFARNDAITFREYLIKTFGIPENNIILLLDAGTIEMHRSIEKLKLLAKNSNGNCKLLLYYAGHGLPDPVTQEAHIIPVDVTGSDLKFAINLKRLFSDLIEYPSISVTIVIDACFSGGGRENGLIASRASGLNLNQICLLGISWFLIQVQRNSFITIL
ncbi:MAG: caspase family protein [Bacteroidales bacterium]